tara:strand:- start:34507 stop:34674 length:168 start_codon:yes stop_codon:yes gene_type:complete
MLGLIFLTTLCSIDNTSGVLSWWVLGVFFCAVSLLGSCFDGMQFFNVIDCHGSFA